MPAPAHHRRPDRRSPRRPAAAVAAAALVALSATAAAAPGASAWTPQTQVVIAREAARLAPPDLWRQLDRHPTELRDGALAPFDDRDPARHFKNPDGTGDLDRVIVAEVDRAVRLIQALRPFEEVVYQLGVVSHYVADAGNPLNTSAADPEEGRYFADYLVYLERTEPRLPVIFYGVRPGFDAQPDPMPLVTAALSRGRTLYPLIGREYRRIGFASGAERFDDRSTAFGIASLSFSHAVSDVGLMLRYIWIRSGGADFRTGLPAEGAGALRLPRAR